MQSGLWGPDRFEVALLGYSLLEMQEDAACKHEEVDEGCPEDFLPAFVDVGYVPFVGELGIAQGVAEDVLDGRRGTMRKHMKKEYIVRISRQIFFLLVYIGVVLQMVLIKRSSNGAARKGMG